MAISYTLGFDPIWYIADLTGKPLGAGTMFTSRSTNPREPLPVFQDPAGNLPYPNPVTFDLNGSRGPFYFQFDSSFPDELYNITIRDANGVLQWTVNNYSPGTGGGGGTVITVDSFSNFLINGIFYRNVGSLGTVSTSVPTGTSMIAPGTHTGLSLTNAGFGPDIVFFKNSGSTVVDTLTFSSFIDGLIPFAPDPTPVSYLNYTCSNPGSGGETAKYIQFPISQGVQNLSGTTVSLTFWARCNGTSGQTLTGNIMQFFGDSSVSSPVPTTIFSVNLTNDWAQNVFTVAIPSISGKAIGGCGNDGLFLQINYPLNELCNIDFTKVFMYIGDESPDLDYQSYDVIDAVISSPRTGDGRMTVNAGPSLQQTISGINVNCSYGWVPLNEGTIGNTGSIATTRANVDTFPLYNVLWGVLNTVYYPMYNSSGVPVARGASVTIDFLAGNVISLQPSIGRSPAGASNLIIPNQTFTALTPNVITLTSGSTMYYGAGTILSLTTSGTLPTGLLPAPQEYFAKPLTSTTMNLALTSLGSPINFAGGAGFGTHTVFSRFGVNAGGAAYGSDENTLTIGQMPAHTHTDPSTWARWEDAGGLAISTGPGVLLQRAPLALSTMGSSQPFSIQSPVALWNMFMKL